MLNPKETNPNAFAYVPEWDAARQERGWWHSFELPDGSIIEGVCSLEGLRDRLAQFPIPQDLKGKRVLDVGCWDGWFSFECERRGAEVVAIDCWDNPRFREMHSLYKSKVDYRLLDVYELTPSKLGYFDIVLFFGVLYHLKHPILALERICALATDLAAVDSFVLRPEHYPAAADPRPVMAFFESDEFGGQTDNWVGPNLACLLAFCRTAGFARVELRRVLDYSACVACFRRWEDTSGQDPAPLLTSVTHTVDYGINFRSDRDDYVTAWFQSTLSGLTVEETKPAVGGFGVRPLAVKEIEAGQWQVNFKLPPQQRAGWHDVTVAVRESPQSNAQRIAVDLPAYCRKLKLWGVFDGATWRRDELDISRSRTLSVWIEGLPENADCVNIRAMLGDCRMQAIYIQPDFGPRPTGIRAWFHRPIVRQVNLEARGRLRPGSAPFHLECANQGTRSTVISIVGAE